MGQGGPPTAPHTLNKMDEPMTDRVTMRVPKRTLLALAASTCAAGLCALSTTAHADEVQGSGTALITKDAESTRTLATQEARRDIVRAMLRKAIGNDRVNEVSVADIDSMAAQIRPDMIVNQTAERVGKDFTVRLVADIDQAWFRTMLTDYDIDSGSMRADGNNQLILVYLDRADGTANDMDAPASVEIEYDRRTGASFSDQSSVTASSKESSGSSYRNSEAARSRASGAQSSSSSGAQRSASSGAQRNASSGAYQGQSSGSWAANDRYGAAGGSGSNSAAGGYSNNGASAYSNKNASAYANKDASAYSNASASASSTRASSAHSASSSFADRTDVQAEVHDDVRYRERVVYQQPPKSVDGDAITAGLKGALVDYDVQVGDSWQALSSYFPSGVPRYDDLKRDPSFGGFLSSLNARNTPFFMGGTFNVTQSGRDPASGQAACSGQLDASAAASADGRTIGSAQVHDTAIGISAEDCASKLSSKLAKSAANQIGPQVQRYWRTKARAATGVDARQMADYTLVLQAPSLTMNMQQDLMDAIADTPGAEMQAFVSADTRSMQVTVRYSGSMPLQFALNQKLRSRPGFDSLQAKAEGRAITFCVVACSAGN